MFSAFAIAEDIVFLTSLEILLSENDKSRIAKSTFFPTIDFIIGFSFFVLETVLLGRALKVNPLDQPAVELIKVETKKILS